MSAPIQSPPFKTWFILQGLWGKGRLGLVFELDNQITRFISVFRQQPHIPVYELKATEDLNRHGMYVLGAIKKIVNKIDDTEYLEKLFDDLSDKHRRIGVEASGMDVFGKVFCKVMRPILLGLKTKRKRDDLIKFCFVQRKRSGSQK